MKDFTHNIYKKFLNSLKKKDYQFITVEEYFAEKYNKSKPFIIIRHDVDRHPNRSLTMAKLENSLNIKATYYFRDIPQTFKPNIIKEIADLGHEIGYHYESLAKTNGDYEKALEDFEYNLKRFRKIYPVKHIAMHGRPMSKWDSRDLWKKYNYKDLEITSEPYFDIDFKDMLYITDAGRAWDNENINLRDKVDSSYNFNFKSTQEIIEALNNNKLPNKIMINIHPEHWAKNSLEWYQIFLIRNVKNFIKKRLLKR